MFENLLALEIRKQKGTFFSLLFVIGLSLAVISIVAYLNSVAGFTEIMSIAVSVLIFLGAITLPLFLGGWSGASLRKEPASSIEEVLPVSPFARMSAGLLITVAQFLILNLLGWILATVLIPYNNFFIWAAVSFTLVYIECVVFLLAYSFKSPIVGIAATLAVLLIQTSFGPGFFWLLCSIVGSALAIGRSRRYIHRKIKSSKRIFGAIIFFLVSPYMFYFSLQIMNFLINPYVRMPRILSMIGEILRTGVHWFP